MTDKVNDAPSPATVVHLGMSDEKVGFRFDAVGIRNLRVLVTEEDGIWVAQGLEIDFAAQGRSVPEVKQRFQDGLRATITEQLKQFESIKQLLVPAHDDVFLEFQTAIQGPVLYSQLMFCVEPIRDSLPITYLTDPKAA